MEIRIFEDKIALGQAAAVQAAKRIRDAIANRGSARVLVAGGAAQVETLSALTARTDVNWGEVEAFHLEEYLGLGIEHPASFRKFLFDHFIHPTRAGRYHLLDGRNDPERVCRDIGEALAVAPVDVAFTGLGENGSVAFNAPPADFQTERPYQIVRLEESCRRQQASEGAFISPADVPDRAISISIRQLLRAKTIVCVASGAGRAEAVRRCIEGSVSPLAPASILQTHPDVTLYLDRASAALLSPETLARARNEATRG